MLKAELHNVPDDLLEDMSFMDILALLEDEEGLNPHT